MDSITYDFIKVVEERPPPKVYDYLLINIRSTTASPTVLKKTHSCERIRLHRIEWLGGFQEVHLNLHLRTFELHLTMGQYPLVGRFPAMYLVTNHCRTMIRYLTTSRHLEGDWCLRAVLFWATTNLIFMSTTREHLLLRSVLKRSTQIIGHTDSK